MSHMFEVSDLNASGVQHRELCAKANQVCDSIFGERVFVRAVIEASNYCRENCTYCGMRRDNKSLPRYRLELDALRRIVFDDLPATVTDINIQTGEDPVAVREVLLPLISEISHSTSLGISVCLGTLDTRLYGELKDAGATYYIIKMETGDEEHYKKLESPGNLRERLDAIWHLHRTGWRVSSGFILGLPFQTPAIVQKTLDLLASLPLAGCSVSPFIPGESTPLAGHPMGSARQTLNAIALMRTMRPNWVIPAVSAMNLVSDTGYADALRSGANLTTINMTPPERRGDYLLYDKKRFIMKEALILRDIEKAAKRPSLTSLASYFESLNQAV